MISAIVGVIPSRNSSTRAWFEVQARSENSFKLRLRLPRYDGSKSLRMQAGGVSTHRTIAYRMPPAYRCMHARCQGRSGRNGCDLFTETNADALAIATRAWFETSERFGEQTVTVKGGGRRVEREGKEGFL